LVLDLVTNLEQGKWNLRKNVRTEDKEWNVERGECCQENEDEEGVGKMKKMV
jgi:hypothetical protein